MGNNREIRIFSFLFSDVLGDLSHYLFGLLIRWLLLLQAGPLQTRQFLLQMGLRRFLLSLYHLYCK